MGLSEINDPAKLSGNYQDGVFLGLSIDGHFSIFLTIFLQSAALCC